MVFKIYCLIAAQKKPCNIFIRKNKVLKNNWFCVLATLYGFKYDN